MISCASQFRCLGIEEAILTHVLDTDAKSGLSDGHADSMYEEQCRVLESYGIDVHVETSVGHPSFSLRDVADRYDAQLTIVAGRGDGVVGTPLSGTTSSDLVLLHGRPVLVTGNRGWADESSASTPRTLLSRVLLATDYSPAAEHAHELVQGLIKRGARDVTVTHVNERHSGSEVACSLSVTAVPNRADYDRLRVLGARLEAIGASQVKCELVSGQPALEVAWRAASGDFTLVVLGSHGRTHEHVVLGKVADRVLRDSASPVLLVPPRVTH